MILWLASYPKSGNTWLRVFLVQYRLGVDEPVDLNTLPGDPIATCLHQFAEESGLVPEEIGAAQAERMRPAVYRRAARAETSRDLLVKVHDRFGASVFPADVSGGAVYVLRNPLDVACAARAFFGFATLDESVAFLERPGARLAGEHHIVTRLGTWSEHVESWTGGLPRFPVHVVRYEDLLERPEETFASVVAFVGLPLDRERLARALRWSRFEVLQQQERQRGFREAAPGVSFFRKGRAGAWREELDPAQIERVRGAHGSVMRRWGYHA